MYKPISETHANEMLSDNSQVERCMQCKDCAYWDGGDLFSNRYNKASCQMFPRPGHKPMDVINNLQPCPFYEKGE